jgi:hypothetical protein
VIGDRQGGPGTDAEALSVPRTTADTSTRRCVQHTLALAMVLVLLFSSAANAARPRVARMSDQKRVCVHDDNYLSGIAAFAKMVGRGTIDCALVYSPSANWAQMTDPWYLNHVNPNLNYALWVRNSPADDRRQLIVSQPLIPDDLMGKHWLDAGARGAYAHYARRFAQNLVNAGVGDAIIRLAWEMNGDWYPDHVPATHAGDAKWVRFWRKTVTAMRSVPGQRFRFDWCPNNGYRDIPLADYYPGNRYVDIIGDDAYDSGVEAGLPRWSTVYDRPSGLRDIIRFAQAHGKPISLPEWGIAPRSVALSGGDDPAYVRGIANVVAHHDVAFQSYFYNHQWATQLKHSRRSLAAYRSAFGSHGYATGVDNGTDLTAPAFPRDRRGRRAALNR